MLSCKNFLFSLILGCTLSLFADNQTETVSPIFPGADLPFSVRLELADFSLPNGVHSYVFGMHKNKWLILAGRTNGLHGFGVGDDNFPPSQQNTTVYVIDPFNKKIASRSLLDPGSGLSQEQIDLLSVTSAQYYQSGKTLYMTGGYGVDTLSGQFSTKDALTAIDVPGLIDWVTEPLKEKNAAKYIKHLFDPIFQVTGGYMDQISNEPTLLVFGQNFAGAYSPNSNGVYTEQIRRFYIIDDKDTFFIYKKKSKPLIADPDFRRRDLNVVPVVRYHSGKLKKELVAFSGVFTQSGGIWNVPVEIAADGATKMEFPNSEKAFKQGMNNYICPTVGLFGNHNRMYTIFFGGLSYGYFENGVFETDEEIPFINQITTIEIDKWGKYKQYLLAEEYPEIVSTQSNPGNVLLFGAASRFVTSEKLAQYKNGVLKLDKIKEPTLIGYIVGGIESTLPNTNSRLDSAASPYIFRVILVPNNLSSD